MEKSSGLVKHFGLVSAQGDHGDDCDVDLMMCFA